MYRSAWCLWHSTGTRDRESAPAKCEPVNDQRKKCQRQRRDPEAKPLQDFLVLSDFLLVVTSPWHQMGLVVWWDCSILWISRACISVIHPQVTLSAGTSAPDEGRSTGSLCLGVRPFPLSSLEGWARSKPEQESNLDPARVGPSLWEVGVERQRSGRLGLRPVSHGSCVPSQCGMAAAGHVLGAGWVGVWIYPSLFLSGNHQRCSHLTPATYPTPSMLVGQGSEHHLLKATPGPLQFQVGLFCSHPGKASVTSITSWTMKFSDVERGILHHNTSFPTRQFLFACFYKFGKTTFKP